MLFNNDLGALYSIMAERIVVTKLRKAQTKDSWKPSRKRLDCSRHEATPG